METPPPPGVSISTLPYPSTWESLSPLNGNANRSFRFGPNRCPMHWGSYPFRSSRTAGRPRRGPFPSLINKAQRPPQDNPPLQSKTKNPTPCFRRISTASQKMAQSAPGILSSLSSRPIWPSGTKTECPGRGSARSARHTEPLGHAIHYLSTHLVVPVEGDGAALGVPVVRIWEL